MGARLTGSAGRRLCNIWIFFLFFSPPHITKFHPMKGSSDVPPCLLPHLISSLSFSSCDVSGGIKEPSGSVPGAAHRRRVHLASGPTSGETMLSEKLLGIWMLSISIWKQVCYFSFFFNLVKAQIDFWVFFTLFFRETIELSCCGQHKIMFKGKTGFSLSCWAWIACLTLYFSLDIRVL